MSSTILIMPLASSISNSTNRISLIFVGGIFWISLSVGVGLTIVLGRWRRMYFKKAHIRVDQRKNFLKALLGLNIASRIAFIVGTISLLVFIILLVNRIFYSYILIILLFLMVFSLCIYFLFNGKNFIYISQLREGKLKHEQI